MQQTSNLHANPKHWSDAYSESPQPSCILVDGIHMPKIGVVHKSVGVPMRYIAQEGSTQAQDGHRVRSTDMVIQLAHHDSLICRPFMPLK